MGQTMIQIPLSGLLIALVVIAALILWMFYRISVLSKPTSQKTEDIQTPFADPRPGPEPVPPVLMPAPPVVPAADPNIKPIRYAYDQNLFERFYVPYHGIAEKLLVKEGDMVKKEEVLMQVTCNGVACEVKASASGKLRELNCKEGEAFERNALLYVIQ